jgi:hypothetical protein
MVRNHHSIKIMQGFSTQSSTKVKYFLNKGMQRETKGINSCSDNKLENCLQQMGIYRSYFAIIFEISGHNHFWLRVLEL